ASATVNGGTVTNVSFFANDSLLGSASSAPFTFTASGLGAGTYSLSAVATASGLSSTSSVVAVSFIEPSAGSVTTEGVSNGVFSFSYSTDPGLTYEVQSSSNFSDWAGVATNVASTSSAIFSEDASANPNRFYRVSRLANP